MQPEQDTGKEELVWDLPTRVFHWTLLALVVVAWVSGEADDDAFMLHRLAGYAILAAVLFRLAWGFVGGRHARFGDFLRPWGAVRDHLRQLPSLRSPRCVGHNPPGGWMVAMLLTLLATLVITGLFAADDDLSGPWAGALPGRLAHAAADLHEGLTGLLLALVALHVAGVLVTSLLARENLLRAMWTGRKTLAPEPTRDGPATSVPLWRAAVAAGLAATVTWMLVAL